MATITTQRWVANGLFALLVMGACLAGARPVDAQSTAGTAGVPATATASQAEFARNLQEMRAQMLQLRATQDPAARAKLLDEHMRTMQQTMQMMMGHGWPGGAMGMASGMGPGRGMGPGMMQGGGMGSGMLQGRGAGPGMMRGSTTGYPRMMQMMMGQMLQHQQAMQAMGCAPAQP